MAVLRLVAAVGLIRSAAARTQPFGLRSRALEDVEREAGWLHSGDRETDIVLKSLLLESRNERESGPVRVLLSAGCSSESALAQSQPLARLRSVLQL